MYVGESSFGHPIVGQDEDGVPYLCASRCPTCEDVRFPERALCPQDLTPCVPHRVGGEGTVYAAVHMELAPAGFEGPLWLAYVDMDAGPRLFAQVGVDEGEAPPVHGDRVTLTLGVVRSDPDPVHGPVFRRVPDAAH